MNLFTKPWADSGCVVGGNDQVATLACIWPLFSNIINAALVLAWVVALIFIIIAGIQIITANGDAEKVSGGKKTLTFAIIGLVFLMLSFTIFNFVSKLTGADQNSIHVGDDGSINTTKPQ